MKLTDRLNNFVFNSMKVAIICICGYVLQVIPYRQLYETENILPVKILFGLLVWSLWYFMVMIASSSSPYEEKQKGGKDAVG